MPMRFPLEYEVVDMEMGFDKGFFQWNAPEAKHVIEETEYFLKTIETPKGKGDKMWMWLPGKTWNTYAN